MEEEGRAISVELGACGVATCERCDSSFKRRTCERACPSCAPLRELRLRAGLSQVELASHAGCDRHAIRDLELGLYHPALALAERIARGLGVEGERVRVARELPPPKIRRMIREAAGLSRRDFGDAIGVSEEAVCTWEEGRTPGPERARRYGEALRALQVGGPSVLEVFPGHRVDHAAALRLAAEREERRTDWISLHAAEDEHRMPWWLLAEFELGVEGERAQVARELPLPKIRRMIREAAGLSLRAFGDAIGVSYATVHTWEKGRTPRPEHARRYGEALRALQIGGPSVLEVFPGLQITKLETQRLLQLTAKIVRRLCDEGELPFSCDGHWHRVDYAAVLRLAAEREDRRVNWISLSAAEDKYGMPPWLLIRLEKGGKLDVVIPPDNRGTRIVRRSQLEAVRQQLLAEHVHCPRCRGALKVGRTAHMKCCAPLRSREYWLDPDPETRKLRWRQHSELAPVALSQRSPLRRAKSYYNRFGSTTMYGKLAKAIAAARDKRPGPKPLLSSAEVDEIRTRSAGGQTQRQIAQDMNVTRRQVQRVVESAIAAGRDKRPKPGPKSLLSSAEEDDIRARSARGQSQRQIALYMNLTRKQVERVVSLGG